jgi:hypothetical protein
VSEVYTPNFSLKIAAALADLAPDELCCVSLSDPDCATVRRKAVFISHYVTSPRLEHAGPCLHKLLGTFLTQAKTKQSRRRRKRTKLRNERNERRK